MPFYVPPWAIAQIATTVAAPAPTAAVKDGAEARRVYRDWAAAVRALGGVAVALRTPRWPAGVVMAKYPYPVWYQLRSRGAIGFPDAGTGDGRWVYVVAPPIIRDAWRVLGLALDEEVAAAAKDLKDQWSSKWFRVAAWTVGLALAGPPLINALIGRRS